MYYIIMVLNYKFFAIVLVRKFYRLLLSLARTKLGAKNGKNVQKQKKAFEPIGVINKNKHLREM